MATVRGGIDDNGMVNGMVDEKAKHSKISGWRRDENARAKETDGETKQAINQ